MAVKAVESCRLAGIGFVFTAGDPYAGQHFARQYLRSHLCLPTARHGVGSTLFRHRSLDEDEHDSEGRESPAALLGIHTQIERSGQIEGCRHEKWRNGTLLF